MVKENGWTNDKEDVAKVWKEKKWRSKERGVKVAVSNEVWFVFQLEHVNFHMLVIGTLHKRAGIAWG